VCITYDDINQAIYDAKERYGGFVPQEIYELSSEFPKPVHVSVPAQILEEATRILAYRFRLKRESVLYALPRVDTLKTAARDICPTFLLPVKCELSKYRTLTGMCNNLNYPSWGASRTSMIRLLPPDYADGKTISQREKTAHFKSSIIIFLAREVKDDHLRKMNLFLFQTSLPS
jgi:hypothetical protein